MISLAKTPAMSPTTIHARMPIRTPFPLGVALGNQLRRDYIPARKAWSVLFGKRPR
jgi:hypothetical protein